MKKSVFTSVSLALVTMLATFTPISAAHAQSEGCAQQQVNSINLVEFDIGGEALLCTLSNELNGQIKLTGLTPGNAYTVWWVYFDDPSQCLGTTFLPVPLGGGESVCDLIDFEGDKPQGVFGRMASGIATRNGKLILRDEFGGMQPSNRAEVWMLVFGHGTAEMSDGSALARQLLTPEDPNVGAPHLGNIIDGLRGYPAASAVFTDDQPIPLN